MAASLNYQIHLDQVSRSFAFCIKELPNPEREWVGLSYLLCRIVDTIEDHHWLDVLRQEQAFNRFIEFAQRTPDPNQIEDWMSGFPESLNTAERELIAESKKLFADLHQLPQAIKNSIQACTISMAKGMRSFCLLSPERGIHLRHQVQLDQYCFFVAGLVGELLTRIMSHRTSTYQPNETDYRRSIHFGLFLQKVNILKDWRADRMDGRVFVNQPIGLLPSIHKHATEAIRYIEAIPQSLIAYRRFCSWSLFIGLASIPYSKRSWTIGSSPKLPRWKTLIIIEKVKRIATSNTALRSYFERMIGALEHPGLGEDFIDETPEELPLIPIGKHYEGQLTEADLRSVGVRY